MPTTGMQTLQVDLLWRAQRDRRCEVALLSVDGLALKVSVTPWPTNDP